MHEGLDVDRKNLVVVMIDSLRRDHVGPYGAPGAMTPSLSRFGEHSIVFDAAYPECLPTIPARRSLMTGRRAFPSYQWHPRRGDPVSIRGWQPLAEEDLTLAEILAEHGYVTGLFADTHHLFRPGMNFTRGFSAYEHIRGQVSDPYRSDPLPDDIRRRYVHPELDENAVARVTQHLRNNLSRRTEEDYSPAKVFRAAAEWLKRNHGTRPLFLWVDCFDPHEPWDPPGPYVDMYDAGYDGREFILAGTDSTDLSPDELRHMRALYAGEVTLVDRWFGWLGEQVRALGLWPDTVFLVLSDHGVALGEHGVISKTPWALYPEVTDVPFLLRVPGYEGRRVRAPIQFHDVMPSLLELLNVPLPTGYAVDGHSFRNALNSDNYPGRDHVVCGYHDCAFVQKDGWRYVFSPDRSHLALYDLAADPSCTVNRIDESKATEMHRLLSAVVDLQRLS